MHEPSGRLFTQDHTFVQIDNEQMFSDSSGGDLWDSPWVRNNDQIRPSGLEEARRLCQQVLSLPDNVFSEALRLPEDYRPDMCWSLRPHLEAVRPSACRFLAMVEGLP